MMNDGQPDFNPSVPRKRSLFAYVVGQLGSRIIRGDLKPGDTLPNETELGRELGASRSVVREAVKALASKGMLEARTRVGTRVLPSTQWNLLDMEVLGWRYDAMPPTQFFREMFEIRRMIEPEAASLAAERATSADIAAMDEAFRGINTAMQSSKDAIEADVRFHRAILAASHNELMLQMGALISVGLTVSFRISSSSFGVFVAHHGRVLEAIRAHDPAGAREAMRVLLDETHHFLARKLAGSLQRERSFAGKRERFEREFSG
jgi:GntR family galactonate operon transcriptional repressor